MIQTTTTGLSFAWQKTRTLSAQESLNWFVTCTQDTLSIPIINLVLVARKQ
jgi:hypothetical protein